MSLGSTRPLRLAALAVLCAVLASCQASPDKRLLQYLNTQGFGKRYTGNVEDENYVTIGDTISIADAYHPELTLAQQVDIDGTVVLPELGAVAVAGFTRTELEAFLTEKFSPYYEQLDVAVQIQAQSKKYFVFGQVGQQGEQVFPGDLTVFEAVMAAQPSETSANLGRVRVIRADPRDPLIIYVNVQQIFRTGDSTFNVLVEENDIIYVPPTFLARIGIFIKALINPVVEVAREISQAVFNPWLFGNNNRGRRGNNNNLFF